jgi:hypothetical protein
MVLLFIYLCGYTVAIFQNKCVRLFDTSSWCGDFTHEVDYDIKDWIYSNFTSTESAGLTPWSEALLEIRTVA